MFLLLFFGYQNFQALMASWRSEPEGPVPPELAEAQALLRAGDPARARELASSLLRDNTPPDLRARIHHLLGWAALKEGRAPGPRRVQPGPEPAHRAPAVAAAFSLVGDDTRAIPLWEQAARQRRSDHLHSGPGAHPPGAGDGGAAIPGVDLATRTNAPSGRLPPGRLLEAARFGEESLVRRPSATQAYGVACAYARAGDVRRAMTLDALASSATPTEKQPPATRTSWPGWEPAFQQWLRSLGKSARPDRPDRA